MSTDNIRTLPSSVDFSKIIAPRFHRMLYWAGIEPIEFDVRAETHVMPPADVTYCEHMGLDKMLDGCRGIHHHSSCRWAGSDTEAEPGVLPISPLNPARKKWGLENGMNADEVVLFAVGTDGLSGKVGRMGVRILSGHAETDEIIKAEAAQQWAESWYWVCQNLKNAHISGNRKRREAGLAPVQPSPKTMRAIDFVNLREMQEYRSQGFLCYECGIPFEDERARAVHITAQHKDVAGTYGLGAFVAEHAPAQTELRADQARHFEQMLEKLTQDGAAREKAFADQLAAMQSKLDAALVPRASVKKPKNEEVEA